MKCRDCENWGWGDDEGTPVWGWCWKRTSCPDPDIDRSCSDFFPKKPDIFTTLSTLQAENEKLRNEVERQRRSADDRKHLYENAERAYMKVVAELEKVKRALAMMWYAYDNKDGEFPHEYEIEAMQTAEEVLGPWAECMPKYLRRGQREE